MSNGTLERDIPFDAKSGMRNESVLSAVQLVEQAGNVRNSEGIEDSWETLVEFFMDQFLVRNTEFKNFSSHNKLLQYAHQKFLKRYSRPKRKFISDDVEEELLSIVRDGVNTVQKRGGLKDVMRGQWGSDHKFVLLGDSFIQIGAGDTEASPVKYMSPPITSVYIDIEATRMRTESGENEAGEVLVIQDMDFDAAVNEYPDVIFMAGKIPVNEREFLRNNKTDLQQSQERQREVQIGHYYNIKSEEPVYTIFAGSKATIIKEFKGDEYPFFIDDQPFIPLINFKMFSVPQGFYGRGMHLIFEYAQILEKLRNLALKQVQDNVDPLTIVNIQGKKSTFLNQALQARELRNMNEKAWIINEINPQQQNSSSGQMTTLSTTPLTAEYERIKVDLETEIKRCGFVIDDIDQPASQTATGTVSEEIARTEFTRQIQRQNEEAYRELDMFTMALMTDRVSEDNDATILTTTRLPAQPGEVEEALVNNADVTQESKITMGDVVQIINENSIDVMMNIGEEELLDKWLPALQGTKEGAKLLARRISLDGLNIDEADLAPPGQEGPEVAPVERPSNVAEQLQSLSNL